MSTASPQASATAAATPTTPPSSSPIKISSSPNPSPTETTPPREDTTTWPKASTSSTTPQCSPNAQPNTASATTPTARASSSSPASGSSPSSSSAPSPRRVKLYRLKDDQWLDLGTGNCVGHFIEGAVTTIAASVHSTVPQEDGAWIIVTREAEEGKEGEVLLRTRIQPYPPGYLSDDEDEDELDGEAREGKVLDIGGYQRQQDTLIVWTEKELDLEMALSFATTGGCGEIWEFIKAARKFSADQPLTSPSNSPSLSSPQHFPVYSLAATKLPEPTLGNIDQVQKAIESLGRSAVGRERTASAIIKGGYVQKLIKIHEEAEDLESLADLHALCKVMQTILLLNDNVIFDLILRDEIILGVASILEYDSEFPTMKAAYRDHLADPSHFTQVVPIRSTALLAKIHQTHRLHYLKDVVLARILEDSTFSMLNSAIYFNEVDIVNEVASDPVFLKDLFAVFDEAEPGETSEPKVEEGLIGPQLPESEKPVIGPQLPPHLAEQLAKKDDSSSSMDVDSIPSSAPSTAVAPTTSPTATLLASSPPPTASNPSPDRKHDAILFLQQFSLMAKNLQLPARSAFFRNLADRGLLRVIEVALSRTVTREDPLMRAATIEILMTLVDHDPTNVRGYSLKQQAAGKRPLVVFLLELFHDEEDLGLKAQMSEALRVLVDAGGDGGPLEAPPRLRQEDPEAEKFLQYFYDHCIVSLLAPILDLPARTPSDPPLDLPLSQVALCGHLCDLLCFFVSHHSFRSKYFVLSTSISTNVSKLLRARHKHIRLAALRFFRACVGKNDDFYNRFLIKNELITPILDIAYAERAKDNLLSSACLEFFEYIRNANAKAIINHVVERHGDRVRQLAKELKTFENLLLKYEQNNEPPPKAKSSPAATSMSMTRAQGSWSARMDVEEESYFNASDDEDDDSAASSSSRPGSRKRENDSSDAGRKRARLDSTTTSSVEGGMSRSKTWPAGSEKGKGKGLVDYGEEDSDEEEPGGFVKEGAMERSVEESSSVQGSSMVSAKEDGSNGTKEEEKPPEKKEEEESDPPFVIGELPRRKVDEDDDELSLLSSKSRKAPLKPLKAALSMATGIKISFGSANLTKLAGAGAGEAKEESSDAG